MALGKAFGSEGERAVVLLGSSLETLGGNFSAIQNSMGSTMEMARRMSNTTTDSMTR